MRKTLLSLALLAFGVSALPGCSSKGIQEADKDKAVVYDSSRDGGKPFAAGGPGGGAVAGQPGTMSGKKNPLPKPK